MQNAQAEILAATYQDKMTVTRRQQVKNEQTHEMEPQEETVYKDAPCALSVKRNNAPEKDSANNRHTISDSYTLFSLPEIWCRAGDTAEVVTHEGQIYRGCTGRSMRYASHAETPLKVEAVV